MRVFIIHGAYGHSKENWFPWLREELEKRGFEVFVPDFPTPEGQSLENWLKVFEPYMGKVDENTVFVAHSLGPAFVLRILEEKPAKACFFVAPFIGKLGIEQFDKINSSFTERKFDFEKIRKNCRKFVIYYSDNDPYVPMNKPEELARLLGAELKLVKGAGHFNEKAGFTEFPQLLEDVVKF